MTANRTMTIERLIHATPEQIWRAWTDRKTYDPALHLGALKIAPDARG